MWWYTCGAGDGSIVLFGGLRLQFDWTNTCVPCTKPCARFPSLHKCTPVSSHPQWRGRRFRMLKSGWGDGSVGKHWTEEITWVQIHRNHINKLGLLTCSRRHSTVVSGVEIPGTNCASIALGPVRDPVSKETESPLRKVECDRAGYWCPPLVSTCTQSVHMHHTYT